MWRRATIQLHSFSRRHLSSVAHQALKSDAWQSSHLSPAVAFLLHSEQYDPSSVRGTGRAGRILKGDIVKAIKEGTIRKATGKPTATSTAGTSVKATFPPVPPVSTGRSSVSRRERVHYDIPLTQVRKVIASRLSASKQSIPHSYAAARIKMDQCLALRAAWKAEGRPTVPSVNDFIIRASALALRQVPAINTIYNNRTGEFSHSPTVDISVAVATETGLITPIIKQADGKRLERISTEMRELASKAKSNKLKPEEFQGGSFTISNLGMLGVDAFSAIINPPQVCILAVGGSVQRVDEERMREMQQKQREEEEEAKKKAEAAKATAAAAASTNSSLPFVNSAAFTSPALSSPSSSSATTPSPAVTRVPVSTFLTVTLVSDERAVDGEAAATFLQAFKTFLEHPALMQ